MAQLRLGLSTSRGYKYTEQRRRHRPPRHAQPTLPIHGCPLRWMEQEADHVRHSRETKRAAPVPRLPPEGPEDTAVETTADQHCTGARRRARGYMAPVGPKDTASQVLTRGLKGVVWGQGLQRGATWIQTWLCGSLAGVTLGQFYNLSGPYFPCL